MRSLGHHLRVGRAALPAIFWADAGEYVGEVSFAEYTHMGSHFFTGIIRDVPDRK